MGFLPVINIEEWTNMCPDCGSKIKKPDCSPENCKGWHNEASWHCHDKKTRKCIPPINDCEEHYFTCCDDCHDECTCQNP